jgi:hypothetical protein
MSQFIDREFLEYNMKMYHTCKNDDTKISYKDDLKSLNSHGFYIISLEWMSIWRNFVHGKGPSPGEIDNYALKKKI